MTTQIILAVATIGGMALLAGLAMLVQRLNTGSWLPRMEMEVATPVQYELDKEAYIEPRTPFVEYLQLMEEIPSPSFSPVPVREIERSYAETSMLSSFLTKSGYETEEMNDSEEETVITEELPRLEVVSSSEMIVPRSFSQATVTDMLGNADSANHPLLGMPIIKRKHVIVAGSTGDGKTQFQIRMMVEDIKRNAYVWWLSPHLALLNDEDQPTDLRPLEKHFRQVFEYADIVAYLNAFAAEVKRRMPFYRSNQPVGETIVLYLDEWPGIVEECGDDAIIPFRVIAREGRKVRIFLSVGTQDALVETMGVKSGVRSQFNARLCGTVDQSTWVSLMGKGVVRSSPARQGEWAYVFGGQDMTHLQVHQASPGLIAEVAKMPVKDFTSLEIQLVPQGTDVAKTASLELFKVIELLRKEPTISNRKIARTLWPESGNGGGRPAMEAGLLREEALEMLTSIGENISDVLPVTEDDKTEESGVPTPSVTP